MPVLPYPMPCKHIHCIKRIFFYSQIKVHQGWWNPVTVVEAWLYGDTGVLNPIFL